MNDENIVLDENEIIAAEQAALPSGGEYGGENVQVLQNADHIRKRPGMYIGDIGTNGLHHLVYELIYNSVDEAVAGHCHHIQVKINEDGSVSVKDDGRGIPVDVHPVMKRSTLEVVHDHWSAPAPSSTRAPTRCRSACTASAPRR